MFLPNNLAQLIANKFYNEDILCRNELRNGILVSERDIVSAFSTGLRRQFSANSIFIVNAQTIPGHVERKLGADAVIIVLYNNKFKIAFYESKWPRIINNPAYNWDYLNNNNYSHFTDQLNRQENFINDFAFWETFYYEGSSGFDSPPFDSLGSSIILQPDALTFANDNSLTTSQWTNNYLRSILRYKGRNLYETMYLFLSCRIGKVLKEVSNTDSSGSTSIKGKNSGLSVPLPLLNDSSFYVNTDAITGFMKENNLDAYYFIDSDRIQLS